VEVDVLPAEVELLGLAQTGVDGGGDRGPLGFTDGSSKPGLLLVMLE
jgi:hypothetical protein